MTTKAERAARATAGTREAAAAAADALAPEAADQIRLARLHLRVGLLALALAELEDLEHRGLLTATDRAILAEARWRTGDTDGAADAARAHLDAGGLEPVALSIAAEAAAADGRPGEARTLMDRLGPLDAGALDALFAGMPRRAFWPSAPPEPIETDTPFDYGPAAFDVAVHRPAGDAGDATVERADLGAAAPSSPARPRPGSPSLEQDPVSELALAREELGAHPDRALLRLALILRLDPTLAPAVLDAILARTEPAAAILRGDAQRLLGRHLEAEAAYASAADGLAPEGEPRS